MSLALQLRLQLRSDATFSSGDGVAGRLDSEIEHDAQGFPRVRGRTLKGLLVEECSNILWSLRCQPQHLPAYQEAAHFLFGAPGSRSRDRAHLNIGPAQFPAALRASVARQMRADERQNRSGLKPADVLNSLTAIRRQSAVDETTGAPDTGSLRSARVLLRHTSLEAQLLFDQEPNAAAQALLAACVQGFRRGGMARNRGRGRLKACLWDSGQDVTPLYFSTFCKREAAHERN